MSNENAKSIFLSAIEEYRPEQWPAFLDEACAGDPLLRAQVEKLLEGHRKLGTFHERSDVAAAEWKPNLNSAETTIGRYKLLEQIGEGGFGVVYLAQQKRPVRRQVALKIIKMGMDTREVIARFEAEQQALALMDHPGIAKVLDAGTTDLGRPYFVMELVKGIPITEYCDQCKLTMRQRLELFVQVCQAVHHAHQKGIIHRDIKPTNVLVAMQDGHPTPKVIDFGVAKAINHRLTEKTLQTGFAQMLGTPMYMSPEQAELSPLEVDTRSDIYSLGVLAYELLTSTTPFEKDRLSKASFDELRRIIREEEPPRPSARLSTLGDRAETIAQRRRSNPRKLNQTVRGDLDWIVMTALDKDRTRRYESASAFGADVQRYLNHQPVQASPPSKMHRACMFARRNRGLITAVAGVVTALLLGTVTSTWMALRNAQLADDLNSALSAANAQKRNAALAGEKAASSAEQYRRHLDRTMTTNCGLAMQAGNHDDALMWSLSCLRLSRPPRQTGPAREQMHRLRLGALLRHMPKPKFVWLHDDLIKSAEFSRAGDRVVTAGRDGAVRVWDVKTGALIGPPLLARRTKFNYAGFSPQGDRILTADAHGRARLWDWATGRCVLMVRHKKSVTRADFSSDGRRFVTASRDNTAQVWDADSGQPIGKPLEHAAPVEDVRFSPDGRLVATAGYDGVARLWDAATGQPASGPLRHADAFPPIGKADPVSKLAFNRSGTLLVTAGADRTARVWDVKSGKLLRVFKHFTSLSTASFHPRGGMVMTASTDGTARIWSLANGQGLFRFVGLQGSVLQAAFDKSGNRVVLASGGGTVHVTSLTRRLRLASLRHCGEVRAAAFSPDDRYLLTASDDGTAQLWDLRPPTRDLRHRRLVYHCVYSPDGRKVATASWDKTARIWDAAAGKPLLSAPLTHDGEVRRVRFSADGRRLATASHDRTARIWDVKTGRQLLVLKHEATVQDAVFSASGRRIVTSSADQRVSVWDAESGSLLWGRDHPRLKHVAPAVLAQFSPDGRRVVLVASKSVSLLKADSGRLIENTNVEVVQNHATLSPDGRRLLTAGIDGVLQIWDLPSFKLVGKPFRHGGRITCAAFSADGTRILTAGQNRMVRVWDAKTFEPVTLAMQHRNRVHHAEFSRDGRFVVTVGMGSSNRPGAAHVWDAATGERITPPLRHPDSLWHAAMSPDGRRILTACGDGVARFWELPSEDRPPEDIERLVRLLTARELREPGQFVPITAEQYRADWIAHAKKYPQEIPVFLASSSAKPNNPPPTNGGPTNQE